MTEAAKPQVPGVQDGPRPYRGKCIIATPFYNMQAWSTYVQSIVQTVQVLGRMGINCEFWPIHGDSYVQRARNTICARFLEDKEATDLFFIDSDESWDVISFLRVLLAPFHVVCGSYRMKNNWDAWTHTLQTQGNTPLGKLMPGGHAYLKALTIPAGFTRIKREALELFMVSYPTLAYRDEGSEGKPKDYFSFFECATIDGVWHGEDATFCRRWRDIGGELWVEPRARITHYGVKGWDGDLDADLRKNVCAMPTA